MKNVFAYTQYCDDVRREIDGRPSLMGVFPSKAEVDVNSDNKLHRLCAYTVINLSASIELESIAVVSLWEGEEIQRVEIPTEAIDDFNATKQETDSEKLRLNVATVIEIRDLDIGSGGKLQTQAIINGSVVDTHTLRLKPASNQAN